MSARWKRYAQLYKEQEEMKSDGVLLQTISRALEWLPNITRVTYSPHPHQLPIEDQETNDLVPRGITTLRTSGSTCSDHPFRQLIAALYMSEFAGVRELRTEPLGASPGTEFALGIFDLDENEMAAARFLFQHLEKLALNIAIWAPRASLIPEALDKLATLLLTSTDLKYLHIHPTRWLPDSNIPCLFPRLGLQATWPKLQALSLESVFADDDEILSILRRHKKTLTSATFRDCRLFKGVWADIVDEAVYGTDLLTFILDCVNESASPHLIQGALGTTEKERWNYEGHIMITQDGDRSFVCSTWMT